MAFAILWYARSKRRSKVSQFGSNFKVEIIVDNEDIKPCRKITGKVIIETQHPIKHQALLIQFEGVCTLKYPTKCEGYITNHHGREVILENASWNSDLAYFKSPIQQVLKPQSELPHVISPGSVSYPFSLDFPENPRLPAPFRNELGGLVYRLVVYMAEPIRLQMFNDIGLKTMEFNGHYNLLYDECVMMTPISIERSLKTGSIFDRKKLVDVSLFVEKSGFLPGELILFSLSFKNQRCLPLHMSVHLMQHVKFNASNRRDSVKRKSTVLGKVGRRSDNENGVEWTWMDKLRIPEEQEPSYTCHYMYNVSYSIQFKVKVLAEIRESGSFTIKGEAPIYIGTISCPIEFLRETNSLSRRESMSSMVTVMSQSSVMTSISLPPPYSQLSSRRPSRETLPPSYDELELSKDTEYDIRFEGLNLNARNYEFKSSEESEQASTSSNAVCESK